MKRVPAIFALLLASFGLIAWAQEEDVIRVDVNLVNLFFTARSKDGAYLRDLQKPDITVFEDGKKQEIIAFSREANLPLTIGMLVDVSPSQRNLIQTERQAASQFFERVLKPKDLAFLISFGADVELLQDYTGSVRLLEKGLGELRVSASINGVVTPGTIPTRNPKGTLLYDAIYLGAHDQLNGQVGRKVLILITDGADQGSTYKLRDAIDAAHRADAIIYSIYYVDSSAYGGFAAGDPGGLKRISEETGGRMFEVRGNMPLSRIFDQIEEEMRSQYLLSYQSTNAAHDGSFRKIEIRPGNKNTRILSRKGYFAASN